MDDHTPGDISVLTTLFDHNAWANLKLLDFCAALSDAQLAATNVGGYGSILDTLRHIVEAEVSYVERVNGRQPMQPLTPAASAGFATWKEAVRWANDELLQLAIAARTDTLVRQRTPRQAIAYPLASLMVQAVSHATEHRTHIATLITQLGIEPPDMSVWTYMDEMGQFQD